MGGILYLATTIIVNDSKFMRIIVKKMLEDAGHQVIAEAKNGREGIELYFRLKPEIVTMDINMTDINGIDAVREICLKDSNARIIV